MNGMQADRIRLDYGRAAGTDLLANLSGAAFDNGYLWTVSDEGRTIECLKAQGDGFVLLQQLHIDAIIAGLPGAEDGAQGAELDLESIDIAHGALWLCGSHCNVQKTPEGANALNAKIRPRPSRHFLACINIKKDGYSLGKARLAPIEGPRALRRVLAGDSYLGPFIDLPSKENGLDIEGIAVVADEVLLGLRGPILDNRAVVVHLKLDSDLEVKSYRLSFLDLGGLAIRDLSRRDDALLVIAGPVGDADGPFRLYRWVPEIMSEAGVVKIQRPDEIYAWPPGTEKPEGLSYLERNGKPGHLFVYDRPDPARIHRGVYEADWWPIV